MLPAAGASRRLRSVGQQFVADDRGDHGARNQPFVIDAFNDVAVVSSPAVLVISPAVLVTLVVAVFIAALECLAEVVLVLVLLEVAALVAIAGVPVRVG